MAVELQIFRDALGRFATGVCILTTVTANGEPRGLTITAFASLSLKPPLVLLCLDKKSAHLTAYTAGSGFAINVLSEEQRSISELFASQAEDRFAQVPHQNGMNGCPLLSGCLANLECTRVQTYEGGDHLIVIGQVNRIQISERAGPLVRFRSSYVRIDGVV